MSTTKVPRTQATAPSQIRVSKSSRPIRRWRASSVKQDEESVNVLLDLKVNEA